MRIRLATAKDLDALVALYAHLQSIHATAQPALFKKSVDAPETRAALANMLGTPSVVWLIAEDPEPCGYLYAQFRKQEETWSRPRFRVCNISHVVVDPRLRRQGVARALVTALTKIARREGCERIELDVWSFNRTAKRAFTRLGFTVFNERMSLRTANAGSRHAPARKSFRSTARN